MDVRYRSLGLGFALLCAAGACAAQGAPELQGAGAALKLLQERKDAEREAATSNHPVAVIRRDLKAYREQAPTLTSRDAAQRWLQLFDRYRQLPQEQLYDPSGGTEALSPTEFIESLPPPNAWSALAATIDARLGAAPPKRAGDAALSMLGHLLTGDVAGQRRDLAALKTMGRDGGEGNPLSGYLPQLWDALGQQTNDPAMVVAALEARMAQLQPEQAQPLEVPDLVTLVGPQRAEALLRKALITPGAELSISTGEATQKLARRLALELVAQLKTPQWTLAQSLDAGALYQALDKRFPAGAKPAQAAPAGMGARGRWARMMAMQDPSQAARSLARTYYMLALIVAGKAPQATAVASALTPGPMSQYYVASALDALDRAGHTAELAEFLRARLTADPAEPLWELYIDASTRVGKTEPMLALARAAVEKKDLPAPLRASLRNTLADALLAADKVDEGIALLRQLVSQPPVGFDGEPDNGTVATRLIRLGRLLQRDDLVREGVRAFARQSEEKFDPSEYYYGGFSEQLVELGQYGEAEKQLLRQLTLAAHQTEPGQPIQQAAPILTRLASLYGQLGRHADVRRLLDEADSWGVTDLLQLLDTDGSEERPLAYTAAEALADAGKSEAAIAILEELLSRNGGFDPAYELLIRLRGNAILPFLDQLARQDRFEERPLIWKAYVLHRAGREEEAEQAARQAITIDPSDGEQKHGRRMRVYSILAEIREARGDKAQAEQLRSAVKAIRLAEKADDLYEAGLLTRGIRLYRESLKLFQDAYCIQSRLAVQLASRGEYAEAEIHYRRAFELMPDSFGRVETHCFGCEGVFSGKRAQGVAERVFTELARKTPEKPQVHYLLGYLRENQGRYPEALAHFRAAVKLDPDYLNAWKHLTSLGGQMALPVADRDAASLAVLRLDPQGRHAGYGTQPTVADLKALWTTVETIRRDSPPRIAPTSLYALAASARAQEKLEGGQAQMMRMMMARNEAGPNGEKAPATPGKAIAAHPTVQLLAGVIQIDLQMEANQ